MAEGRAPVREGAPLVDAAGNDVGIVTSGGFGPSIGTPVAMGYVNREQEAPQSVVYAVVRGKQLPMVVTPMPFVKSGLLSRLITARRARR